MTNLKRRYQDYIFQSSMLTISLGGLFGYGWQQSVLYGFGGWALISFWRSISPQASRFATGYIPRYRQIPLNGKTLFMRSVRSIFPSGDPQQAGQWYEEVGGYTVLEDSLFLFCAKAWRRQRQGEGTFSRVDFLTRDFKRDAYDAHIFVLMRGGCIVDRIGKKTGRLIYPPNYCIRVVKGR